MTSPDPEGDPPRLGRLLGAVVALTPALLAAVRACWLAHGDMLVMTDVLRRVDFLSLLAGSVVLSAQSGALLLLVAGYRAMLVFRLGRAEATRLLPSRTFLGMSAVLVALVLLTSNYWLSAFTVFGSLAVGLVRFGETPVLRRTIGTGVVLGAGFIVAFVLALAATAPWPPPELLRVTQEPAARWVYVLSVEDTHTTVLYPQGGVARIANSDVAERALCSEETVGKDMAGWAPSALRQLLADPDEAEPPLCRNPPPTGGL